jgi:hypothetical protein
MFVFAIYKRIRETLLHEIAIFVRLGRPARGR